MIGEPKTPSFSQLRKRMGRLDVNTYQGGMIAVSDPKHSRILAADATGLKQHNRGEWMGKKWRVKRGFVKLHVMVDTQTMKIVALSVTDESVGDVTEFRSLLGQSMDAVGAGGGADDAPCHSQDPGPNAPTGERCCAPSRRPAYQNHLASGISPLTSLSSDRPDDDPAPDIIYGDVAYGSRCNMAACACAGIVPGIPHGISATARCKGSGDAWGVSVRDQLVGGTKATRPNLSGQRKKGRVKHTGRPRPHTARGGWRGAFSISKRAFGERAAPPSGRTSSWRCCSRRPCAGGGTSRQHVRWRGAHHVRHGGHAAARPKLGLHMDAVGAQGSHADGFLKLLQACG